MFQEVSLDPNGWHIKLQKWVFGHVPFKNNFCPFFWLTIFCGIAAPFLGLFRLTLWTVSRLYSLAGTFIVLPLEVITNKAIDAFNESFCEPWFKSQNENYVDKMGNDGLHSLFDVIFGWSSFDEIGNVDIAKDTQWRFGEMKERDRNKYLARWKLWKSKAGDNWEEELKSIRENKIIDKDKRYKEKVKSDKESSKKRLEKLKLKKIADIKDRERRKIADKKRKELYAKIAVHTKYVLLLIIGTVVSYVLYGLGLLGVVIAENSGPILSFFSTVFSWIIWFTPWLFAAIVLVALLVMTAFGIVKLVEKCSIEITLPDPPEMKFLKSAIEYFGKLLSPVADKIISMAIKVSRFPKGVATFFAIYVKTIKENHCPAIKWEEE